MQSHCTQYALLSAEHIFAVSYDWLTKNSDEMATETSRILVYVMWLNFRHSFSFVDENLRLLASFRQHDEK